VVGVNREGNLAVAQKLRKEMAKVRASRTFISTK